MISGTAETIVLPSGVNACDQVAVDGYWNAREKAAGLAIDHRSRAP